MKNHFNGKLSGKGTAAIICFCLAAVAALGIFSYNKSAKELRSELSGVSSTSETAQTEAAQDANAAADNVPVEDAAAPQEDIILEHDAFGGDEAEVSPTESDAITGAVVRPADGEILEAFSDGELVKSRTLSVWKTHDGIDIAAKAGTTVLAASSGTVRSVTDDVLLGTTVVLEHEGGYQTTYANLQSKPTVETGDSVSAGQIIGAVGSTAMAEAALAPHLHFAVEKDGDAVDPQSFLK